MVLQPSKGLCYRGRRLRGKNHARLPRGVPVALQLPLPITVMGFCNRPLLRLCRSARCLSSYERRKGIGAGAGRGGMRSCLFRPESGKEGKGGRHDGVSPPSPRAFLAFSELGTSPGVVAAGARGTLPSEQTPAGAPSHTCFPPGGRPAPLPLDPGQATLLPRSSGRVVPRCVAPLSTNTRLTLRPRSPCLLPARVEEQVGAHSAVSFSSRPGPLRACASCVWGPGREAPRLTVRIHRGQTGSAG
jgi:hypothetical protein